MKGSIASLSFLERFWLHRTGSDRHCSMRPYELSWRTLAAHAAHHVVLLRPKHIACRIYLTGDFRIGICPFIFIAKEFLRFSTHSFHFCFSPGLIVVLIALNRPLKSFLFNFKCVTKIFYCLNI